MVNVNVTGGEMSQAEINSYIDRAQKLAAATHLHLKHLRQ